METETIVEHEGSFYKVGDTVTFLDWDEVGNTIDLRIRRFFESTAYGPCVEGAIAAADKAGNIGPLRSLPLDRVYKPEIVSLRQVCTQCGKESPQGTRMSKGLCKPCRDGVDLNLAIANTLPDPDGTNTLPVEIPKVDEIKLTKETVTYGGTPIKAPLKQKCTSCGKESPTGSRVRNGLCKPCRDTQSPQTAPSAGPTVETLRCASCDQDFDRVRVRGRKPKWCPECHAKIFVEKR